MQRKQKHVIYDQRHRPYSRKLLLLALLLGSFPPILNETLLATAYPKLMSYFSIGASTVQWLTSAFLMTAGIMIPISAWLMKRINTKILFIVSLFVFLAGTVLAWQAPTFGLLLFARILQAISTGVAMPLMQSVIFYVYPKGERGGAMGLAGIVLGLAPAIGPTLSGWIIDHSTWRVLFSMNVIPTVLTIVIAWLWFRPVLPTHDDKLDVPSVVLSTFGFGILLYGFSSVGQDGWTSNTVLISLCLGVILVTCFIFWELLCSNPLIDLSVFKNKEFNIGTLTGSLVMMGMVGFEMILPLYLQTMRGDNAFESGLTLLPGALMIGLIAPLTGVIYDKHGARDLAISGFLLLSAGSFPFLFVTAHTPTVVIIILYGIRSVGIAMSLMTITTYSMNTLKLSEIDNGTSATNTVKQIASSIATAILTSVLSNTTKTVKPARSLLGADPFQFKHDMITSALTGYHAAFMVALAFCIIGLVATFWIKDTRKDGERA